MRHLLHDPHFPDIVGEWVASADAASDSCDCANDNAVSEIGELAEPFLTMIARMDVEANRLW